MWKETKEEYTHIHIVGSFHHDPWEKLEEALFYAHWREEVRLPEHDLARIDYACILSINVFVFVIQS